MRSWWMIVLATGCAGEVEQTPVSPDGSSAKINQINTPKGPVTIEELLAKPPPPLGPSGQLVSSIAKHYNVGTFRCPITANGRLQQIFGTERDRMIQMGPIWEIEIDPATEPAWDHLFDEVTGEENWVTGLAMPGTTRSYARGRGTGTYVFDHPPAVAGSTVVCTASHKNSIRTVKGKVTSEKPFGADSLVAYCADLSAPPLYIKKDGTFEVQMPVPCVVWVEQQGYRSEKILVEEGEAPLELSLTMTLDPLIQLDGEWTKEGHQKAEETVLAMKERLAQTTSYLESLKTETTDPLASNTVARLLVDSVQWGYRIERALKQLTFTREKIRIPPPPPPKKPQH